MAKRKQTVQKMVKKRRKGSSTILIKKTKLVIHSEKLKQLAISKLMTP